MDGRTNGRMDSKASFHSLAYFLLGQTSFLPSFLHKPLNSESTHTYIHTYIHTDTPIKLVRDRPSHGCLLLPSPTSALFIILTVTTLLTHHNLPIDHKTEPYSSGNRSGIIGKKKLTSCWFKHALFVDLCNFSR